MVIYNQLFKRKLDSYKWQHWKGEKRQWVVGRLLLF